ncbi:MAG: PDZ domain-containing protein [Planctomycetota bacterium]
MNRMLASMLLVLLAPCAALAVDVNDTRMLTQPAVSARHVAFVYAGDLWVADLQGKGVRRLTSGQGVSTPAFARDGAWIAFSAQYEGNTDVYVVPVEGGVPTRLTWHPGPDIVRGFTADGAAVLFASPRAVFTQRYMQLYTVPLNGGFETQLEIPHAFKATYAPDGSRLAYVPLYEPFNQWKHYRGGTVAQIWLYRFADHSIEKIPQPDGRCNDTDPMWIASTVYFRSDRNGEFNLFAYDTNTRQVTQLTSHADFPVVNASAGGGKIVYEQAGSLHLFDPATHQAAKLTIGVPADLVDRRPRFVKGSKWIRSASLSPSGARAVFDFRGEIVTVPAEKGNPRNLTSSPGVHECCPAWSPDGKSIAYFADDGGEYHLVVEPQDGRGERKTFSVAGAGFYDAPAWSPDNHKIAFSDNSWSIYILDLDSGATSKVASEALYGPEKTLSFAWSPDSKWLAYSIGGTALLKTIHVYSLADQRSTAITDGLSEVGEPRFDPSGKYLYFFASTDAGPVKDWFAQSNNDMRATSSIYLAVLQQDVPSPLAKESDEEKAGDKKEGEASKDEKKGEDAAKKEETKPKDLRIDFETLSQHILALPVPAAAYATLRVPSEGQLYYLKTVDGKTSLQHYDLLKRKEETALGDASDYELSADGKKILYLANDAWSIASLGGKVEGGSKLALDGIEVKIDPPAEWAQIFDEAWRINRDYFYAPNMHGVDWKAMKDKYAVFLPHLATRDDLNRVIQWMCSELGVGHHRVGGGDSRNEPKTVPGGLLGADFAVENGRYRISKVYGGLNWNPGLRSPLTEPGVDVKAGEYLLAVNGHELKPPTNLFSMFENTADKIVEISVGPSADGSGARSVSVVPIGSEAALRNRDWVEGNLKKVNDRTGGRVAYVYVPNTAGQGYEYFKRYFYPQINKEAIIVDERMNGGGQVADYYIDMLRRPLIAYWATRYGADLKTPTASIQGPKVMIIDETAGSGGDLLPWMFHKFKLGPLVGKRTWGGLVGILGFPMLMDGGSVTAPNLAIWTEDGWVVENEGVPPDIDVEQTPADVIAGRDPQLDKAIEVALKELEKNPPPRLTRPPYHERMKAVPAGTH